MSDFGDTRYEVNSTSKILDNSKALDNWRMNYQVSNMIVKHINGYKVSTINNFIEDFNETMYPNNYPFFLKDCSNKNYKGIILQWAIPLDDEYNDVLHDTTEYTFIDVLKVSSKTEEEVIVSFLNIDLDNLRELLQNHFQ